MVSALILLREWFAFFVRENLTSKIPADLKHLIWALLDSPASTMPLEVETESLVLLRKWFASLVGESLTGLLPSLLKSQIWTFLDTNSSESHCSIPNTTNNSLPILSNQSRIETSSAERVIDNETGICLTTPLEPSSFNNIVEQEGTTGKQIEIEFHDEEILPNYITPVDPFLSAPDDTIRCDECLTECGSALQLKNMTCTSRHQTPHFQIILKRCDQETTRLISQKSNKPRRKFPKKQKISKVKQNSKQLKKIPKNQNSAKYIRNKKTGRIHRVLCSKCDGWYSAANLKRHKNICQGDNNRFCPVQGCTSRIWKNIRSRTQHIRKAHGPISLKTSYGKIKMNFAGSKIKQSNPESTHSFQGMVSDDPDYLPSKLRTKYPPKQRGSKWTKEKAALKNKIALSGKKRARKLHQNCPQVLNSSSFHKCGQCLQTFQTTMLLKNHQYKCRVTSFQHNQDDFQHESTMDNEENSPDVSQDDPDDHSVEDDHSSSISSDWAEVLLRKEISSSKSPPRANLRKPLRFKCKLCPQQFKTSSKFQSHKIDHMKESKLSHSISFNPFMGIKPFSGANQTMSDSEYENLCTSATSSSSDDQAEEEISQPHPLT